MIETVRAASIAAALFASSVLGEAVHAQTPNPLAVFEDEPSRSFRMIRNLEEISGLAWHPSGYLLTHDDERGWIYTIDPDDGEVVGRARLHRAARTGDFEGITLLDPTTLLVVTSSGRMTRLDMETGDSESWRIGTADTCEIEGLATLRADRVVLACKTLYTGNRDALVLLEASALDDDSAATLHLTVSEDALRAADVPRPFFASGVEVVTGGYLVISAQRRRALHLSTEGEILGVARLDGDRHRQAEGVTIGPDGSVWIADEGDGRRGRISYYPTRRNDG